MSCASFYAALLSRENAAILPAMLTVTALYHDRKNTRDPQRWNLLLLWSILAAYLLQRDLVFEKNALGTGFQSWEKPLLSYLYMLQTILLPPLALEYEPPEVVWLSYEKSLTVLIACICIAYRYRFSIILRNEMKYWLAWMLLMFAPTANILTQQTEYDERHCLVILPALFGIVLSAGHDHFARFPKKILFTFFLIAMLSAGITQNRAQYFTNDFDFASQWLKVNPEAGEALAIMGTLFWEKGNQKEALELFKNALKHRPNMASSYDNIGCLLGETAQIETAAKFFRQAVALDPQNFNYRYNLAVNFLSRKMYIECYINLNIAKSHGQGISPDAAKLIDLCMAQSLSCIYFGESN